MKQCPFFSARFLAALLCALLSAFTGQLNAGTGNIISDKAFVVTNWKYTVDKNPGGVLAIPADSVWRPLALTPELTNNLVGNWLLTAAVIVNDSMAEDNVLGLFPLSFVTAYEIYWDGVRVARNGIIGADAKSEKAGSYLFYRPLPQRLVTPGTHNLVMRLSNHAVSGGWRWYYGDLVIAPYDFYLKLKVQRGFAVVFAIGILMVSFLFNLFLYFARRRRTEHLLFSVLCLLVMIDSGLGHLPLFINYSTVFIEFEYYLYPVLAVCVSTLLPLFFIYHFGFPKKLFWPVLAVNLIVALLLSDEWTIFHRLSVTMLAQSTVISAWSLWKKHPESIIVAVGIAAAWAAFLAGAPFHIVAVIIVICVSLSVALQFGAKERSERESKLRSSHLENELLKKNINPHFLLNSLTSVIVWLRRDPPSAIKLIESLADEFRMINQISPQKLIPLSQEIELCRAHLRIMNFRKGADFRLDVEDLDDSAVVPPMIFHTLIENGLTHGYENRNSGVFTLQRQTQRGMVRYILSNDGDLTAGTYSGSNGFGIKYIQGRLEESYPGRWKLISRQAGSGWETVMEIKD